MKKKTKSKKSGFKKLEDRLGDIKEDIEDTFDFKEEPKEKKEEASEKLIQLVKENSVCNSCLASFDNRVVPTEDKKVNKKFDGKKVYSFKHSECKDKPNRIYVIKKDKEDKIVEVPAKYIS